MPRFRSSSKSDALVLSISPIRKLVFAAYCKQNTTALQKSQFWSKCHPDTGYWLNSSSMPKNLGVALAHADENGGAGVDYYGGPFERLTKAM